MEVINMKKLLMALVLLPVLFVSCSKDTFKAKTAELVTKNLSLAIVTNLECAKSEVVTADVKAKVDDVFKIQAQGNVVAETFCKTVVDLVVPQVIGATLPTTWECKATNATAAATDLIKSKGCEKL